MTGEEVLCPFCGEMATDGSCLRKAADRITELEVALQKKDMELAEAGARVLSHEGHIELLTKQYNDRGDRLLKLTEVLSLLQEWTNTYGKELCPPGADTYGEGVRDSKQKVQAILSRLSG